MYNLRSTRNVFSGRERQLDTVGQGRVEGYTLSRCDTKLGVWGDYDRCAWGEVALFPADKGL